VKRTVLGVFAVLAVALATSGCGGNGEPTLKVSAASSLKTAFESYAKEFGQAKVSFSFAGSDELAAQIRQGVKPDVFAAANTKLPDDLHAKDLVGKPVPFATNRLLIAIPNSGSKVKGLADLAKPGVGLAAGAATVPIGIYTREVLGRLGDAQAGRIERNIRSNEPDVAGVVAKVAEGAVDAGFVYTTDVIAAKGKLVGLELPSRLQPRVVYGAAVVNGASHRTEARAFVDGLLAGAGRNSLRAAGFGSPR
jgi:molybdate transport system substrate-binding protein